MKSVHYLAIPLIAAMVLQAGCSTRGVLTGVGIAGAAAAGAAAVYYAKGDLEADVPESVESTYEATVETMGERGYTITEKDVNALDGTVKATIPEGDDTRSVTINLERTREDLTHVSIRIGVFGDESLSREILSGITGNIKEAAEAAETGETTVPETGENPVEEVGDVEGI